MNRNGFLVFAVTALIFLYIIVYRLDPKEYRDMARFVPADSLMYATHKDGVALVNRISSSTSFKKILEINGIAVDQLLGSKHLMVKIQGAMTTIAHFAQLDVSDEIFGRRYGVVIHVPQLPLHGPVDVMKLLSDNLTLIAEPRNGARVIETIGKGVVDGDEKLQLAEKQYGSHIVSELKSGQETIYFSVIRRFIAISFSEQSLRKCIDCFDGEIPSILDNNDFRQIRDHYENSSFFTYLSLDNIRTFIKAMAATREFSWKDILLKELATTEGFSGVGYGNWIYSDYVQDKIVAAYDSKKVNELVRDHLQIKPTRNTMLSLGTMDPMFYYWSNALIFKHFLMYLRGEGRSPGNTANLLPEVDENLVRDVRQLLQYLGDEVSLVIEKGQEHLWPPVPEAVALVQTTDIEKVEEAMSRIMSSYNIPMKAVHYGPATYYRWSSSPQDGFKPLYGFWDDLFFVGNSSEALKKIIDQNITGSSILDSSLFTKADPGFKKDNNSTTFSNNVKVLRVIRKALEMFSTFIALEDKETAIRAKYLLRSLVFPLLDCMTTFESIASRSYFTPEAVIVESVINLAPPTKMQ